MSTYENYKRWSNNCAKLSDILEKLPARQHDQRRWASTDEHTCRTTGCAMGWAAMSGQIENLSSEVEDGRVYCLSDGKEVSWDAAAIQHFGPAVYHQVFLDLESNKKDIVRQLRVQARVLCDQAKDAKKRLQAKKAKQEEK